MKFKSKKLSRLANGLIASAFALGVAVPALLTSGTAAAAELSSSSVMMSNSTPSATGVTYQFSFTTAGAAQSMVIDFCTQDAIIGDSCTAPSGFNIYTGTSAINVTTGGAWTVDTTSSEKTTANHLALTASSSVSPGSQVFTISNVDNPSTTSQGFYARITTYTGTAYNGYTSPTGVGTYVDYGGVAMSTAAEVLVTARVMPTLQFCVSAAAPTAACGGTTTPDIDIGHGTIKAIDDSAVDTASVYSQLSTNAQHGAVIQAKFFPTGSCYGLADGNGDCINPVGSGTSATPVAMTAGAAAFGLMVENGTAISGGTGSTAATNVYNDGTHNTCNGTGGAYFNFRASSGTNMASTYGDEVASSTGAVSDVNNTYCFGATANATTPSGVYTADLSLIATGTF